MTDRMSKLSRLKMWTVYQSNLGNLSKISKGSLSMKTSCLFRPFPKKFRQSRASHARLITWLRHHLNSLRRRSEKNTLITKRTRSGPANYQGSKVSLRDTLRKVCQRSSRLRRICKKSSMIRCGLSSTGKRSERSILSLRLLTLNHRVRIQQISTSLHSSKIRRLRPYSSSW